MYAHQLARWTECFPANQLLVIQSESMFSDPQGTVARVFRFLGLSDSDIGAARPLNAGHYGAPTTMSLESLKSVFSKDVARLRPFISVASWGY
jgi:hypothetical protein